MDRTAFARGQDFLCSNIRTDGCILVPVLSIMPTQPDQSAALAAKQATLPEVVRLFEKLAGRAETYARMQDEFLEGIVRHREARTGKPFRYTTRQQQMLGEFDQGTEQARKDLERVTAKMDDRTLLISAVSSEYQQLEIDESMASSYPLEDREMAQRMVEFRRETIRMIEQFVETSSFRGQVVSIWPGKKKTKAA